MPTSKIQRRSHIIKYHCTWEDQAKSIIKFVHMNGNENTADIVTKSHAYITWLPHMEPLLFLSDMDFLKY